MRGSTVLTIPHHILATIAVITHLVKLESETVISNLLLINNIRTIKVHKQQNKRHYITALYSIK